MSACGEGECSLIKAAAEISEIFSAAPKSRILKSQYRDKGWEKVSCGTS